ncbi:hypothetical protein B0H17DRAFT_1204986 [Mycena rosella]|uniref:C2H2-type domain-containing protein n=1 Tax=Mycena rosella TaxID=1033263 RepID=A0AAD7D8S5_MYCRO|nr:hypothetical protein B0H17DRAFT_1204986 [Mycena rosella]
MDVQMEREFCSNFKCCNMKLSDLHALFDHLGTCHQNRNIYALPFSMPCTGSSPTSHPHTYAAFSEFLQPMWPSPPPRPPLHLQKAKTLFAHQPLPLVSPTASESSSTSSTSSSAKHFNNMRSAYTRDNLYNPVSIPSTLRMDQPKESAVSWSISSPASFYGYYPPPAPTAPIFHAPTPLRPNAHAIPANVEAIDVDIPPPCVACLPAEPLPRPMPAPPASTPLSASPPPVLESEPAAAESGRPRPAAEDEPPAKRHCSSNASPSTPAASAFLAALRRRFFRPPPFRKGRAGAPVSADPAPPTVIIAAAEAVSGCSTAADSAMEVETNGDVNVCEEGEALGGGKTAVEVADGPDAVLSNDELAKTPDADAMLDSEQAAAEVVQDSDSTLVSPVRVKPAVYMDGKKKGFVCPVPGCIKAYLTLNGLRYHEQKGTCITADGVPCVVPVRTQPAPSAIPATVSPAATTSAPITPKKTPKPARRRLTPTRHSTRLASSANKKGVQSPCSPPRPRSVSLTLSFDASDSESGDSD